MTFVDFHLNYEWISFYEYLNDFSLDSLIKHYRRHDCDEPDKTTKLNFCHYLCNVQSAELKALPLYTYHLSKHCVASSDYDAFCMFESCALSEAVFTEVTMTDSGSAPQEVKMFCKF